MPESMYVCRQTYMNLYIAVAFSMYVWGDDVGRNLCMYVWIYVELHECMGVCAYIHV